MHRRQRQRPSGPEPGTLWDPRSAGVVRCRGSPRRAGTAVSIPRMGRRLARTRAPDPSEAGTATVRHTWSASSTRASRREGVPKRAKAALRLQSGAPREPSCVGLIELVLRRPVELDRLFLFGLSAGASFSLQPRGWLLRLSEPVLGVALSRHAGGHPQRRASHHFFRLSVLTVALGS